MRMTQNKQRVYEAVGYINAREGIYPPHNAANVRWLLREELEYGDFDLANITRTLKALVVQGVLECTIKPVDVGGDTGCIHRWFQQERVCYWPADLDLDEMTLKYKGTPEEQDLKQHNLISWMVGAPAVTMEEYRTHKARRAAELA